MSRIPPRSEKDGEEKQSACADEQDGKLSLFDKHLQISIERVSETAAIAAC